jgi:hypothetical protein
MVRVFIFLAALQLIFFVLALISALSVDRVRNVPRALWVLIIILIPLIGPLAYFLWGRPTAAPLEGSPPAHRSSGRPTSPDDDPDFLRKMNSEQSRRDREILDQWEREFNKRNGDDDK